MEISSEEWAGLTDLDKERLKTLAIEGLIKLVIKQTWYE